jgi:hypothetical protein
MVLVNETFSLNGAETYKPGITLRKGENIEAIINENLYALWKNGSVRRLGRNIRHEFRTVSGYIMGREAIGTGNHKFCNILISLKKVYAGGYSLTIIDD